MRHALGMSIEIRTILVPIDFSEHARCDPRVGCAPRQASTAASRLILLHAYHLPVEFQQLEGAYLPPGFLVQREDAEARSSRSARYETEDSRPSGGSRSRRSCARATRPPAIVDEATRAQPADLIVIGTHGLSGLKHMLLGSIAERVVQKAPCPVLTVKTVRSPE